MGASRVYSTLLFPIAAVVAILLSIFPKFGAVIQTFPQGVLGGLAIVLFGLIAVLGGKIWVEAGVDFRENRNLFTAAISVLLGAGMVNGIAIEWGPVVIDGIGTSTIVAILLWQLLRSPKDWVRLFRERDFWYKEVEAAEMGKCSVGDVEAKEEIVVVKEEPVNSTLLIQEQLAGADKARRELGGELNGLPDFDKVL